MDGLFGGGNSDMAGQVKEPPAHFEQAYVIGTGFSKAFGEGLLGSDVYNEVLGYCSEPLGCCCFPDLRKQLEGFVSEFALSERNDSGKASVDIIRLFTMLQVAESEWGGSLRAMQWPRCSHMLAQLKKVLGCVYHKKLMDKDVREKISGNFFEDLPDWVPIVSLNWDNLLEYGLYAAGRQVVYISADYHSHPHDEFDWRERCFVFKPHGSVDWFLGSDAWTTKRLCDQYYPISFPLDSTAEAKGQLLDCVSAHRWRSVENLGRPEVIRNLFCKPYEPMILTLGHHKFSESMWQVSAGRERLLNIVEQAECYLARSKRIIVIGYSLPEDDYEIEALLKSSVAWRKRECGECPEIVVVNPDDSAATRFKKRLHHDVIVKRTAKGTGFEPNARGGFVEDKLEPVT